MYTKTVTPKQLPRIEWAPRSGAVLQKNPLSEDGQILGLNLARGCVQRCTFCSARAYSNYPGDEVMYLYRDSAALLARELKSRSSRPRAVFVSPSTDPFPPHMAVQWEAVRVVDVLARAGVQAWLMTRGYIRPFAPQVLAQHRQHIRVTIPLTTLDAGLQRSLEPWTASPSLRLRQIARLRQLNIPVQVALDPLLPNLTDTRDNLLPLLRALSDLGVTQLTASYMFLRPGIRENLVEVLSSWGAMEKVLNEYAEGPILEGHGLAGARFLPKARRQRGYAGLMSLAANFNMQVTISGTSNPDFASRPTETTPQRMLLSVMAAQRRQVV